jgi:Flp pilus assembly protein TadB
MFLFQLTFRRDYFEPMLTRPIGIALLVACAVSLAFGSLVMKKIVKVEM